MTYEQRALAERAEAAGCRWMPGMLAMPVGTSWPMMPDRVRLSENGEWSYSGGTIERGHMLRGGRIAALADFDDPATEGCLRAQVQERFLGVYVVPSADGRRFWVRDRAGFDIGQGCAGPTYAAALVAALEYAQDLAEVAS